jgi:uncharacterized protein DUF3293
LKNSELSTDLIANYLATNYQVGTGTEMFILHINQYSASLSRLLTVNQKCFATIITAHNPFSQQHNNEKNLAANEKLLQILKNYSHPVIESMNMDPTGAWPAEKSFCVLGLNLETSKFLGQKYNQNAIVWADSSTVPQLILLR